MSILSIDIGGTSIKYALMGKDAVILSRGKIPTPQEGRRELVEAIGRLYDEMPDVEGIAISMPGIIDSENDPADGGHAQPVKMEFPEPIVGGGLQEAEDFSPGVHEVIAAPLAVGIFEHILFSGTQSELSQNTELTSESSRLQKIHKCHHGLRHIAAPLVIESGHSGRVGTINAVKIQPACILDRLQGRGAQKGAAESVGRHEIAAGHLLQVHDDIGRHPFLPEHGENAGIEVRNPVNGDEGLIMKMVQRCPADH